nr:hypothetical protein Iba_chr07cCG5590 [Ipomoea batatas]
MDNGPCLLSSAPIYRSPPRGIVSPSSRTELTGLPGAHVQALACSLPGSVDVLASELHVPKLQRSKQLQHSLRTSSVASPLTSQKITDSRRSFSV